LLFSTKKKKLAKAWGREAFKFLLHSKMITASFKAKINELTFRDCFDFSYLIA